MALSSVKTETPPPMPKASDKTATDVKRGALPQHPEPVADVVEHVGVLSTNYASLRL